MFVHQYQAGADSCSLPPSSEDRFPLPCWAENPQIVALALPEEEGLEGGTRSIDPRLRASPRPRPADVPEGRCISLETLLETKVHSNDAYLFE